MYENGDSSKKKELRYDVEFVLAQYCMPTICKRKPSNLIQINKRLILDSYTEFYKLLETEVMQFECNNSIIFENDRMAIILIYNMQLLDMLLLNDNVMAFLKSYQYNDKSLNIIEYLNHFKERYLLYCKNEGVFPHEIGIFLGYPLADVEGFIKNHGQNYILNGFWKVYQDREKAEEIFVMYQRLREIAIKLLLDGKKLKEINTSYLFQKFVVGCYNNMTSDII